MKKSKKLYWAIGAAVFVLAIAAFSLNGGTEAETIIAEKGNIQRTVVENGTVNSKAAYDLYTAFGGTVVSLPTETGQTVKKGEIVIVLNNPEISMQVSSIKAQLAQVRSAITSEQGAISGVRIELDAAQKQFEKVEKLYDFGAASQTDYDNARLIVEKLQNSMQELNNSINAAREQEKSLAEALSTAETSSNELIIRSPMEGKLMYLNCDLGQVVMPGTLIASVAVSGELEVKVDVLSDDIAEVEEGQTVAITAPVLGEKVLSGKVIQVYPQAEEKMSALGVIQRRVPVIISLDEVQNLKPGYEVRAAINTVSKENILIMPREAIRINAENKPEVMMVIRNKIEFRTVETGIYDSENIEIIKGIEPGDIIIRDAGSALKEGTKVK
jgi:HlyD family secretion protein